jgi:hypothetical protein
MNRLRSKYMGFALLWILSAVVFFAGCEKDTDGPLNVSKEDFSYDGEGFFAYARLDSGKTIHLSKDTLYLDMGKMYTFSNCALKDINLSFYLYFCYLPNSLAPRRVKNPCLAAILF